MTKMLTTLRKGDGGKVIGIDAGKTATKRLYEMGFNTGASVKIIKNDSGPVIVSLNGNKMAVGRGLAGKIQLEATEQNAGCI
jgi:ferrous iron transport protein A